MKRKVKFIIVLAVEFIAVVAIILLIFFAGKKVYTITFDINGGVLISGNLEQHVTQGQSATPPQVTKDGCYFLEWEGKYQKVTKDAVIKAIWEYETTEGIEYNIIENSNYCTIKSCYKDLVGDVYIGAYFNEYKVLGIESSAFKDCTNIKNVYLLDGILNIDDSAFEGCTSLESIIIPDTVVRIGNNVFKDCSQLTDVIIGENVKSLGDEVFSGCSNLKEIIIPMSVEKMGYSVFTNNIDLVINCEIEEQPDGWDDLWFLGDCDIVWNYKAIDDQIDEEIKK